MENKTYNELCNYGLKDEALTYIHFDEFYNSFLNSTIYAKNNYGEKIKDLPTLYDKSTMVDFYNKVNEDYIIQNSNER
jgi:hypothetical protein